MNIQIQCTTLPDDYLFKISTSALSNISEHKNGPFQSSAHSIRGWSRCVYMKIEESGERDHPNINIQIQPDPTAK